ncbi:MAG: CehA/McbA family metallohydrolase [Verrucomicrobia bacterium]|nr:CehA/McbA family metallohydrolase [Verrucomicrobiota bacterium]
MKFTPLKIVSFLTLFTLSLASAHEATWAGFESQFTPSNLLAAVDAAETEGSKTTKENNSPTCKLRVSLIDANTAKTLPGLIRVSTENGVIPIEGLVNRGLGLDEDHASAQWYALLKPTVLSLPQESVTIEAISGIDSELSDQTIDLSDKTEAKITLKIKRLHLIDDKDYYTGNTHLHLKRVTRKQADEYLQVVPEADRVDLVFVSYLLRTSEDKTYITNEYRRKDLRELSTPATIFGFGEEYRNNFDAFDMGYGHVMFLDIRKLIQPVSIGSGIMDHGPDFPNLKQGIDQAHQQDATVIWCHNSLGHEDIPNWVTGNIHAQNIFDGGTRGTYNDTFYRYLNSGLRVPFSTGTDWFIYDFSRVYAQFNTPLTEDNWLNALKAGRTFITNGPLLQFNLGEQSPGDILNLPEAGTRMVTAKAQGRHNFGSIELIVNGEVVHTVPSKKVHEHYEAEMNYKLPLNKPSWVALRIPETEETNELGGKLFAHTSPIYVNLAGKSTFSVKAAQSLITEMYQSMDAITEQAEFNNDRQQRKVLDYYRQAILQLGKKVAAHSASSENN